MKLIYTTILAVVCALTASLQTATAQTTLFSEDFTVEAYKVTLTLPWEWVDTAPVSSISGGHYIQTAVPRNPGNSSNIYSITLEVNTVDYKDVQVSWQERNIDGTQGNKVPDILSLQYRTGKSGEFKFLAAYESTNVNTWAGQLKQLGSVAANVEQFELRWIIERPNGSTRRLAIDDIIVTGTFVEPINPAPFPVELASFVGQSVSGSSKLAWTTASETSNDKFEVERSQDGSTYSKVGEVKGNGNSVVKRNYVFTDKAPVAGINYYRLRQVNNDGSVSFSNVVALEAAGRMSASVYPTVASSVVTISLQNTSGKATIHITDITGKTVATINSTTLNELEVPVQNFKSGMYFVRVADGENQQVQRFIKE